jgi:hypothetical protein
MLKEIFSFYRANKKLYLFPIILVLILFGLTVYLASGSVIAPFIYTLF